MSTETEVVAPPVSDLDRLRARFVGPLGSADEFDAICEIAKAVNAKPKVAPPEPKPVSKSRGARPKMRAAKKHARR